MQRSLLMLCIAIATLGTARTAKAETMPHEVLINGAALSFPSTGASSAFNNGALTISAGAGYIYSFHSMIGFGIYPMLSFVKPVGGASTVLFNVSAGPTFNFPMHGDDIDTAFFLTGAAGIATGGAGGTSLLVRAEIGKRFKLFEHVTWRPSFGMHWDQGTMAPTMVISLGSMSLVF